MSPETFTAVVADATLPTQKFVKATLATIADSCTKNKITPPALFSLDRLRLAMPASTGSLNCLCLVKPLWLPVMPKVTPNSQAKIAARMAVTIEMPVTKIKTLTDSGNFIKTLAQIKFYDWIIFTSCNGVETFFAALTKLNKDARVFGKAQIAAIGVRTAETLARFGIKADFVPNAFTSKDLAAGLIDFTNLHGKKVLLLRSQIASDGPAIYADRAVVEAAQGTDTDQPV